MFLKYNEYMEVMSKDKSKNTLKSYRSSIEPFLEYFNISSSDDIVEISKMDIVTYRDTISGKISTVNTRMRPIMAFLNWLVEWEYLEKNPMKKIKLLKEPTEVKIVLTDDECTSMDNACKNIQDKLLVWMLIVTGARVAEITNMKVDDIYNGTVLFHGKGNKERAIPIREDVLKLLKKHLSKHNDEYIFSSRKGGGKISTDGIRFRIRKIAMDADIPINRALEITPHSLRRTFATSLIDDGVSINIVQKALGHSNINTTIRYAQVRSETMNQAILSNNQIAMIGAN